MMYVITIKYTFMKEGLELTQEWKGTVLLKLSASVYADRSEHDLIAPVSSPKPSHEDQYPPDLEEHKIS